MLETVVKMFETPPQTIAAQKKYVLAQFQLALFLEDSEQKAKLEGVENFLGSHQLEGVVHLQAIVQLRLALLEEERENKSFRLDQAIQLFNVIPETLHHGEYAATKAFTLLQKALLQDSDVEKILILDEAQKILIEVPEAERNSEENEVLGDIIKEKERMEREDNPLESLSDLFV